MEREDVNVADLKLDAENPRHDVATSQRDIIDALLNKEGNKMIQLAEDIAEYGLSPIDDLLVLKEAGPSYTVVEGNRRLASVKLLGNPSLTSMPKWEKRFRAIKKKMVIPSVHEIAVATVGTRAEAKHWQELRHTGQRGGRGVVPWDTEASTRFYGRRGSQAEKALAVIDALVKAYPGNKQLQDDLRDVRKNRLTTFGRLVSDPYVRSKFGLVLTPVVGAHYPADQLEAAFARIASELTTGAVTVSGLKSKDQRRKYVLGLGADLPDETKFETDARQLVPAGRRRPAPKAKAKPKPAGAATKPLFDGVELTNLGGRVAGVLTELQALDVDKFPNASAALLRVVVELAVSQVYAEKKWAPERLRVMVQRCVNTLDPKGKEAKYQAVRAGLTDGTSVLAVATIHAYLHNPHYNPTPTDLRSTSSNYAAFLAGLDTLV